MFLVRNSGHRRMMYIYSMFAILIWSFFRPPKHVVIGPSLAIQNLINAIRVYYVTSILPGFQFMQTSTPGRSPPPMERLPGRHGAWSAWNGSFLHPVIQVYRYINGQRHRSEAINFSKYNLNLKIDSPDDMIGQKRISIHVNLGTLGFQQHSLIVC